MSKSIMVFTAMTMVFAAALVAQATLPSPVQTLAVNNVIQKGPWTITISGSLTVDPSTRSVSGTLTAVVTDKNGNVVATADATLNVVNGSGTATFHLAIPALGVDVDVTVDINSRTITTAVVDRHVRKLNP